MAQTKVRANGEPHGLQWDLRGTQVVSRRRHAGVAGLQMRREAADQGANGAKGGAAGQMASRHELVSSVNLGLSSPWGWTKPVSPPASPSENTMVLDARGVPPFELALRANGTLAWASKVAPMESSFVSRDTEDAAVLGIMPAARRVATNGNRSGRSPACWTEST
jgi:hypothetical protein